MRATVVAFLFLPSLNREAWGAGRGSRGNLPTATLADYIPALVELGVSSPGRMNALHPHIYVNELSGNLVIMHRDVDMPPTGDFGLAFARTHNSGGSLETAPIPMAAGRLNDSPLGAGWTGHYGALRLRPGLAPEILRPDGGSERFLTREHLFANRFAPQTSWMGRDMSVLVSESFSDSWIWLQPHGLRTTFRRATQELFVPVQVEDVAGNRWWIDYRTDWDRHYATHPLVTRVRGEDGRGLDFVYVTIEGRDRLAEIRFNGRTLSRYSYSIIDQRVFLTAHITPTGRTTRYAYKLGLGMVEAGAMAELRLDTGGIWTFGYVRKRFAFRVGQSRNVLAIEHIARGRDVWTYAYDMTERRYGDFTTTVSGPEGRVHQATFSGYTQGLCGATPLLWRVGLLLKISDTQGGQTHVENLTHAFFPLGHRPQWQECRFELPGTARLTRQEIRKDGQEQVHISTDHDLLRPGQVTAPGEFRIEKKYTHNISLKHYFLHLPTSEVASVAGHEVHRIAWLHYDAQGQPEQVRLSRSAGESLVLKLSYGRTAANRGRIVRHALGRNWAEYGYERGILTRVRAPAGSLLERTLDAEGRTVVERRGRALTRIAYDRDGEWLRQSPAGDMPIDRHLTPNLEVITRGAERLQRQFDPFGGLIAIESRVGHSTRYESWRLDAYGQRVQSTTATGLTYTLQYDLLGRLVRRSAKDDDWRISYSATGAGSSMEIQHNGVDFERRNFDLLGRIIRAQRGGNPVTWTYAGTDVKVSSQKWSHRLHYDFMGNLVSEALPGGSSAKNVLSAEGWTRQRIDPTATLEFYHDDAGRITRMRADGLDAVEHTYVPDAWEPSTSGRRGAKTQVTARDLQNRPTVLKISTPMFVLPPHLTWDAAALKWVPPVGAVAVVVELDRADGQRRVLRTSAADLPLTSWEFGVTDPLKARWRARAETADGHLGPSSPWIGFGAAQAPTTSCASVSQPAHGPWTLQLTYDGYGKLIRAEHWTSPDFVDTPSSTFCARSSSWNGEEDEYLLKASNLTQCDFA